MRGGTSPRSACALALAALAIAVLAAQLAQAEQPLPLIFPEQRRIEVRAPADLAPVAIPNTPPPETISNRQLEAPARYLSLDEAIRTALANAEVVRILAGVSTTANGGTIYDTAIANVTVDEAHARFDPVALANNTFSRVEQPVADFTLLPPVVGGERVDAYNLDFDVSKTAITGGTVNLGVNATPTRLSPSGLRETSSSVDLSYTQPLLQGGGRRANLVPIVLARIDTERSYFQFKDSVQELVRSVIDAYWQLVLARVNVWVREQQVEQLQFAYDRASALLRVGGLRPGTGSAGTVGDVAQARVSLFNARAALLAAQADLLDREAALRNLLGFPPYDDHRLVPTTTPVRDRLDMDWQALIQLASQQRPDIIELKLVLEADQQRRLQAANLAHPRVDAVALYRWNGLDGEVPVLGSFASRPGQFTDWTLAVNFSVPLGLRAERANLRRHQLLIARDRANLDQAVHNAAHILALNLRSLALFYEQYEVFRETRADARINLDQRFDEYRTGRTFFLNVLQAIVDWANAVNSEAQTLLQYNLELANLERQTGTILESHGVVFFEERYGSVGPLGWLHADRAYASSLPPGPNDDRYGEGAQPAEKSFDLESPAPLRERLPPPEPGAELPPPPAPMPGEPMPERQQPMAPRPNGPS